MPTYTVPSTRATGYLVTATNWNDELVGNMLYFKDAPVFDTAAIIGAATTNGVRLDLESGTLAVREGDDSAYAPIRASVYNIPSGGSLNFTAGSSTFAWDATDSTATLGLSANTTHALGANEFVRVVNRTGTTIAKGAPVYVSGAFSGRPEITLADASVTATAATTIGITAESIADAAEGFVCVRGLLRGVDTNSLTAGQPVWLSETTGALTSTRPTQPARGIRMGYCITTAPGTSGVLYISVDTGSEIDDLHNVLITTAVAGNLLKRNSGNTLWINEAPAALTKTDDTNVTLTLGGSASTALVNAASLTLGWAGELAISRGGSGASTAQAAMNAFAGATTSGSYLRGNGSNVVMSAIQAGDVPTLNQNTTGTAANVTGTVAVANGGTGQTTYTNGQLLIGNTTGNTLTKATLTAGTGISITNGTGSITIANTGGTGTVTSVSGTGTANGLTLSGTVTTTGNITLSGTVNSMSASAGSETAPSIAASGDSNTGIYFPAADTLSITTGGVERLRCTSGAAVVIGGGEGTATVAAQTLRGAAGAGTNIAGGNLTIEPGNGTGQGGSGAIIFRLASPSATSSSTPNTMGERLRILTNGNVALGPQAKLLLDGTAGTGDTYINESSANNMSFHTNNTERLRLTSSGHTAIPATAKLLFDGVSGTGDTYITEATANNLSFFTNGSEALRLDDFRRTLIGGHTTRGANNDSNTFLTVGNPSTGYCYLSVRSGGVNVEELLLGAMDGNQCFLGTFSNHALVIRQANNEVAQFTPTYGDFNLKAGKKLGLGWGGAISGGADDTFLQETSANVMIAATGGVERLRLDNSGNVGINVSSFGTSAAGVLALKNGTEPSSGPADTVQFYSVDRSAGNTIPAVYCEGSGVTNAGITSTTVTHKIALKVNGTVYYLLATTNAT